MFDKTIAAVSTPAGVGGVAIIRLSGDNPLEIAERMFTPLGSVKVPDFEPYRMYVGEIDAGGFTDFGMCVFFKGPKSYTGEDMVEFHCHGGIAVTRGVCARAIKLGARPATNGEFTKRAFLNGKCSLSSAEGLISMINSESVSEVKAGYYLYREKLTNTVYALQQTLTAVLSLIDVNVDFPEEDSEASDTSSILNNLNDVKDKIGKLIGGYNDGRKIKNGVRVALVGKPNTGKSSLLNALLNYDKAIVTDIAGTTRDVVEGEIDIKGVRFIISDTAGIRESTDTVEKIGVERSVRALENCDIAVVVLDSSNLSSEDEEIIKTAQNKPKLIVLNKCDLFDYPPYSGLGETADLEISVKTGKNIEELKNKLFDEVFKNGISASGDLITESRHYYALKEASAALDDAISAAENAVPIDLLSIDVKRAWNALGAITGETASENIIDEIFSRFCVGK